jgi:nitronate monooxygenase
MWSQNALIDPLNLKWPILQAPMGNFTAPALGAVAGYAGHK